MVSTEKIIRKFASLDEYLDVLRKLADTPVEDFIRDKILNHKSFPLMKGVPFQTLFSL